MTAEGTVGAPTCLRELMNPGQPNVHILRIYFLQSWTWYFVLNAGKSSSSVWLIICIVYDGIFILAFYIVYIKVRAEKSRKRCEIAAGTDHRLTTHTIQIRRCFPDSHHTWLRVHSFLLRPLINKAARCLYVLCFVPFRTYLVSCRRDNQTNQEGRLLRVWLEKHLVVSIKVYSEQSQLQNSVRLLSILSL
jgi:hypothetical protein